MGQIGKNTYEYGLGCTLYKHDVYQVQTDRNCEIICLPNVCRHYYDYMSDSIYKILLPLQWQLFQETRSFRGSKHDARDGFIHLCSGHQLADTLSKHFTDVKKIVLVRFCADHLVGLRWETSRDGEKFPHLYNPLYNANIKDYISLRRIEENEFIIPESFLNS